MCGLFVVAKMLFSPLSTFLFLRKCNISQVDLLSHSIIVAHFKAANNISTPQLKTINILTKYNIIYSTFDTSNFNFSESEWLEICWSREREREMPNEARNDTTTQVVWCSNVYLQFNWTIIRAQKSFLFELRLRISVFAFTILQTWIEPIKFLM